MSKIKVLFLAANPRDTKKLALDEEIREIASKIRAAEFRDSIDLVSGWAVKPDDLIQLLNEHMPQIVHFSGHGSASGEIILTDDIGNSKLLNKTSIKALFTTLKDNIRVVFFNFCYSQLYAEAVAEIIDCAIGMNKAIGDRAAIIFAASFYRAIGFGRSIKEAFDQGIVALQIQGISEEDTPKLFVRSGVDPSQVVLIDKSLSELSNIDNIFRGESRQSEAKSIEITPKRREAHTSELKGTIKNWIENFPKPHSGSRFLYEVGKCEQNILFQDLSNHLAQSGFDVCGRWERYKNNVMELDKAKNDLLTCLERAISTIFPDLGLKFVEFHDLMKLYDFNPPRLKDFESSLPRMMFEQLLFELDIDDESLEAAETEEEYEEIRDGIMKIYDIWMGTEDRVKSLPILEKDNSIIWGDDGNMELIRVPKSLSSSLIQGKEKAISIFLEKPNTIKPMVENIFADFRSLETERENIIEELNRSLYCQCFLGDCRYLGA